MKKKCKNTLKYITYDWLRPNLKRQKDSPYFAVAQHILTQDFRSEKSMSVWPKHVQNFGVG